jgi:5-formyltetrahydrofolate cyclo-ligase
MFYASFRSEAETMPCISQALKLKKMVLLPLVDRERKTLRIFQISELSELAPGFMGIPEPKARRTRERHLDDVEVVLIPGAGFDSEGNRLGYGAGYYDRLLSKAKRNITKIALAFEEQIVPEIPSERHDIRMDKIITDKRTIDCKKKLKIKNQNAK